jgi:hypothetical protein
MTKVGIAGKLGMHAVMAAAALSGAFVKDLRVDVPAPKVNPKRDRRIQQYRSRGYLYPNSSTKENTRTKLQYVMVTNPHSGFTTMQKRKGTAAFNMLASMSADELGLA